MSRRLLAPTLAVAAATALVVTTLPAQGAAPAGGSLTTGLTSGVLAAAVPSWAHRAPDAAEPASADVSFVVQLTTRNAAQLTRFAAAVSDPSSASYRHFLTPAEYAARYAPTAASAKVVSSWAAAAGLHVDTVTRQRTLMSVHGPASAVASAFDTSFGLFHIDGLTLRSPLSAPVIPAALRGIVANVAGLAQTAPLQPFATPSPVFLNARPCGTYYGQKKAKTLPGYEGKKQSYAVCGYSGKQLRTAYGVDKTKLTGKGATVGIVDAYASKTILKDANTYSKKHGLPAFGKGQYTEAPHPAEGQIPEAPMSLLIDPQGWAGEQTLDVEAVHSMAPGAKVRYGSATSPYGPSLYLALDELVESGDVQVVTNSYGTATDSPMQTDITLFNQITTTAASMGVTITFSSGDSGDETDPSADGARTADFPATSTGVVAVGGTSLHVNKKGRRTKETYWGTRKDAQTASGWDFKNVVYSGAGGGGVSTTYDEPAWQKGVVPPALTMIGRATPGRVEPDVSMDADSTTGFLTGQTQTFKNGTVKYSEYRIGGTSLSSPLFAGVLALAVGKHAGKGLGLVTPTLYAASKTSKGIKKLFNDPSGVKVDPTTHQTTLANVRPDFTDPTDPTSKVTYSLRTLGNLATLHRLKGYDDSTGLGTPKVAALIARLLK